MTCLVDNILAQMAELELMGKRPRALLCDRDSLAALIAETGFVELRLPDARLFGLRIAVDTEPNFDVVP